MTDIPNSANRSCQLSGEKIPEELALEVRKLAHDLSNALEIIVQTSYLLSTVELKEPASDWLRMLDNGVKKALDINMALRTYIKNARERSRARLFRRDRRDARPGGGPFSASPETSLRLPSHGVLGFLPSALTGAGVASWPWALRGAVSWPGVSLPPLFGRGPA